MVRGVGTWGGGVVFWGVGRGRSQNLSLSLNSKV